MPCEYLSLETLEKWIVYGFMLCHTFLSHEAAMELWSLALNSSWCTVLYRDEVVYTHSYVQTYFESIKGYGKKVAGVKECVARKSYSGGPIQLGFCHWVPSGFMTSGATAAKKSNMKTNDVTTM